LLEMVGETGGLGWVAVKAVLMFAVAVIGLRLGERRTLAQLGAFDFAVAVAIGAIIGRTVTAPSASFAVGAVALVTLLVVHRLMVAFMIPVGGHGGDQESRCSWDLRSAEAVPDEGHTVHDLGASKRPLAANASRRSTSRAAVP